MKQHPSKFQTVTAALLGMAVVGVLPLSAAPAPTPKVVIPVSTFILPLSPAEGRDPFFPNSTRPYENAPVATNRPVMEITSLTLRGISGTPDNRLAIINNHAFAVGDEGEVIVPGGRIRLRCVEIRSDSVVIEVAGQRHELFFSNNQ